MSKRRAVTGGGIAVEVEPDRLVGWVNRFGGRNDGLADLTTDGTSIVITAGDGTTAVLEVPFGRVHWALCWSAAARIPSASRRPARC